MGLVAMQKNGCRGNGDMSQNQGRHDVAPQLQIEQTVGHKG